MKNLALINLNSTKDKLHMELILDLSYLNEISGGDTEFIADILQTFLEETPSDMQAIADAVANNDNVTIGKMCHKTKSTLQLLGFLELKELALKIEQTTKKEINHPQIQAWAIEFMNYMEQTYPKIESVLGGLQEN